MAKVERKKELFRFGMVMAIALAILSALFFYKGRPAAPYFAGASLFFFASGLFYPALLSPIHKAWMKFADILSWGMNRVILSIAYFVIITPIGLIMRLVGKDPLERKYDAELPSYWQPVDEQGPCSRPEKPF